VQSTNATGLGVTSPDATFTTVATPIISDVAATAVTGTGATITWTTDQLTDAQVEFGATTAYGSTTSLDSTLASSHSRSLSGLTPGSTYHFRVHSTNSLGMAATSPDATLTTVAPPAISGIVVVTVTGTSASIAWTTDQPATSQIEYGPTSAYGSATALDSTSVTTHGGTLTSLAIGTTYHFRVCSTNGVGLLAVSDDHLVTTLAPPVIAGVNVNGLTGTTATIAWTTDLASTSQVEYGLTTAYGSVTPPGGGLATAHAVGLAGLSIGTTYHYRAYSTSAAGLTAVTGDATFTTVPPPAITGVAATGITRTSATVSWMTDQPADSIVEYGTTSAYGRTTSLDPTLMTGHGVAFSGLTASTTYHYRVSSRNGVGLANTSADFSFTTAAGSDSPVTLTITRRGTGHGTVAGPSGIDCGSACSADLAPGTAITLSATADPGTVFTGWSGACSGVNAACTLTINAAATVVATFTAATPGDFDGDGFADLVWQYTDGTLALWSMQGSTRLTSSYLSSETKAAGGGWQLGGDVTLTGDSRVTDPAWHLVATADFDGNGRADLLWQNVTTGQLVVWIMDGAVRVGSATIGAAAPDATWQVQAAGDLDGDGHPDLVWRQDGTGALMVWFMNGTNKVGEQTIAVPVGAPWRLVGTADFDGDGQSDLLWQRDDTGDTYVWFMNGASIRSEQTVGRFDSGWQARAVADFDADGHPDIIWEDAAGDLAAWFMNGTTARRVTTLTPGGIDPGWTIKGAR